MTPIVRGESRSGCELSSALPLWGLCTPTATRVQCGTFRMIPYMTRMCVLNPVSALMRRNAPDFTQASIEFGRDPSRPASTAGL
jgi:hypothetical protein